MSSSYTVICVLRSGGDFEARHVRRLLEGVQEHWPFVGGIPPLKCAVLSDLGGDVGDGFPSLDVRPLRSIPWPGWWSKMELFRPDLEVLGDLLYFDLDTTIVGNLTDIVLVRELTMLSDFFRPERQASGMMLLPVEMRREVWVQWLAADQSLIRTLRGDQDFLARVFQNKPHRWQDLLPGQVISYKVHVQRQRQVPEGARVICFHGRPRPWQLPKGALGNEDNLAR